HILLLLRLVLFLLIRPQPTSTLFPYTTLFRSNYAPESQVPGNAKVLNISGTQLRQRLAQGREIPEWFTFPEIVHELRRTHPARRDRKSTRLNSSHEWISYAVFCLKKKTKI